MGLPAVCRCASWRSCNRRRFGFIPSLATAVHTAGFVVQVLPTPVTVQRTFAPQPKHLITTYQTADGGPTMRTFTYRRWRAAGRRVGFSGRQRGRSNRPRCDQSGRSTGSCRFAVMYHWSTTLGEDADIAPSEIDTLVAAFQHLRRQDFVDPDRIGLAGSQSERRWRWWPLPTLESPTR